ncbi:hypothetical protein HNR02_005392 [Amycolatopsis endophytica]|uniref:Uncharacterized protein n=1 Tax=Amycolatopsis endophytica TaxID=860233 RepID=A0A853BBF5_9PSEU|nr:hypothetical protein [Amycolatopsis endophytica]NYI92017.1 hypothetical protein [Amycolatopsis endophytica]
MLFGFFAAMAETDREAIRELDAGRAELPLPERETTTAVRQ